MQQQRMMLIGKTLSSERSLIEERMGWEPSGTEIFEDIGSISGTKRWNSTNAHALVNGDGFFASLVQNLVECRPIIVSGSILSLIGR